MEYDDSTIDSVSRTSPELDRMVADAEPSPYRMMWLLFRGGSAWVSILAALFALAFFVLQIVCAVRFFAVEETRLQIGYAACFVYLGLVTIAMKIWFWMGINRRTVLREVKRLEMEIARLGRLSG